MKRIFSITAAVVLMTGLFMMPAMAVDLEVSSGIDIYSAYVWRGMTFNDGVVAQPVIDVSKDGFCINAWGNLDLSDYDGIVESGEFSEVDVTLSYGRTLGNIDTEVGYIEYLFPATEAGGYLGTREIYLNLGMGLPAGLSAALDTNYDINEVEDIYSKLSLSYATIINDKTNLDAGISMAYAGDEYCGDGEAGLYDYQISVSLGYALNDCWSLSASLTYVDAIDSDNLVDVEDGGLLDVKTYAGIGIGYSF